MPAKLKCGYDDWKTAVVKGMTSKMLDTLRVMADGQIRTRADMLRSAGIEPNPRTENGFVGNERTDYYLYKKGLIAFVGLSGAQKKFQITEAGRKALK